MTAESTEGPFVGRALPRREDEALLTGRARYTDDLSPPGVAHLAFVRSQYGHARVESIDGSAAAAAAGVLGVYTWDDVAASGTPGVIDIATDRLDHDVSGHPILARDRVRYHGQPVAAVVAEDRYLAHDAAAAVDVEYDRLPAVTDPVAATAPDAPTLYEAVPDNVAVAGDLGDREATERAFAAADHVVELDLVNNRIIPNALEPRAALASYDSDDGRYTLRLGSQGPHRHRGNLATTLGVPEAAVRVVIPDVGGGFGHKGYHYPGEAVTAWCARALDRPVKWVATRSENYLAGGHGRDNVTHAELALDADGTILGLSLDTHVAAGGYGIGSCASIATRHGELLSSQYRIPAIYRRARGVFTNTAPVVAYRGAGRPESIYVVERLVDAAARELGLDPAELRRRNLVPPDAFPYETAAGAVYDSGEYERALDAALELADYEATRERQDARRAAGELVGVGLAAFVESTGGKEETARVSVGADGRVAAYVGTHSHGQGHETTFAQIVADALAVPPDVVDEYEGDTDDLPTGTGTSGSRSTVSGGSAVDECARTVAEQARRVAAGELEAAPADVAVADGEFHVVGSPDRAVPFDAVAAVAHDGERTDRDVPGLEAETVYRPAGTAFSFGAHVAVVAVDPDTGAVDVERYVAVDDCGERINPALVDGQVHGGVAQGIGQARFERTAYDDTGTLVTGSLMDYAVPRAFQLPEIETDATVTPSPTNPLGVKGVGEAGTIAAPPAVVNAVCDALAPLGVRNVDMPMTDESVWRAIGNAEEGE